MGKDSSIELDGQSPFEFYNRFKYEVMYLWNDEVECYVKCDPKNGCFIKFKGKKESPISADSKTVVLAVGTKHEVTKEEYEEA